MTLIKLLDDVVKIGVALVLLNRLYELTPKRLEDLLVMLVRPMINGAMGIYETVAAK